MTVGNVQNVEQVQASEVPELLCRLLRAQIASARDGNLSQVERLCAEAEDVVTQVKGAEVASVLTAAQRTRLEQLYRDLVLTLQAERADVGGRLKQLRNVKKAVGAYGGQRTAQLAGPNTKTGGA
jgi:hypothetical protein